MTRDAAALMKIPMLPLKFLNDSHFGLWTLIAIHFISEASSSVKASAVQEEVSSSKSQAVTTKISNQSNVTVAGKTLIVSALL